MHVLLNRIMQTDLELHANDPKYEWVQVIYV